MNNSLRAILLFTFLTTLYFIINYNTGSFNKLYFGIYILLILIGELFINLDISKTKCGSNQWGNAIVITLIPWLFIFGFIVYLIKLYPGWLVPFSNTLGYGVAMIAGLNKTIEKIFKDSSNKPDKEGKILAKVFSDKSLLINEINIENYDNFWNRTKNLFRSGVESNDELKSELYNFIRLKYLVAEYIWYVLAGILIRSISYNYIINSLCNKSVVEMQNNHDDYEKQLEDIQNSERERTNNVYEIND